MIRLFLLAALCSFCNASAKNQPQLIKDITPGPANSDITELTPVGDVVLFIAPDGANGFQLWRTDGTEPGTYVVKVINPGITGMYTYITSLVNVNGTLFFLADDGTHGVELWR